MRKFIEIVKGHLLESLGPVHTGETISPRLWHGTTLNGILGIISSDSLNMGWDNDEGPQGVSLTRRLDVAQSYAADMQGYETADSYPQDFEVIPPGKPEGAVIEVDGPGLVHAGYVVRPFVWESSNGASDDEEAEDRVIRRNIAPLSQVMTAFYVSKADLEWCAELHAEDARAVRLITALIGHPKRREMP